MEEKNEILEQWSNKYRINYLNYSYRNSNYQKNRNKDNPFKTTEVLITNF